MKSKRKKKRMSPGLIATLAICGVVVLCLAWMALTANTVKLMRATVTVEQLPPAFEGVKLLYVSDIDLMGNGSAARAGTLFKEMEALSPDMLILGGDYNAHSLPRILNRDTALNAEDLRLRQSFFHYIENFDAPLGKYALAAPDDGENLYGLLDECGFKLLNDSRHKLERGDDALWLVGVNQNSQNIRKGGQLFRSGECVIAVADSPDCFPILNTVEAADGGRWVDLCLAGHTHGGQIMLLNRSLLTLSTLERQYRYGWTRETGVPMLTTSGLGCEGVGLRFGTQAEAWLITLTAGAE